MTFEDLKELFRDFQVKGVRVRITYNGLSMARRYRYKIYAHKIPWRELVRLNFDEVYAKVHEFSRKELDRG
jgi:hypothetical protein